MLMIEFTRPADLVTAIGALRERGAARFDAYTPFEVQEIQAALPPRRRSRFAWVVLAAGLAGGFAAYMFEWWINVVDYPLNIGGRPDHSWPSFIPIAFEMAVLCAGLTAFFGAILVGGLPRLYHPVFDVIGFERATRDRFWLSCEDPPDALPDLAALGAARVVWT
jgi:hypothetical protein